MYKIPVLLESQRLARMMFEDYFMYLGDVYVYT